MILTKIIAVDFDGTLCENKWPDIGEPNHELINHLKEQRRSMTAEQAALKAEQDKKTALINAEKDKEVSALRAEQEILVAQGEAEAMRIKKDALSSMPETYIQQLYLEKWDGKLPQIITEGSDLMIAPELEPAGESDEE